MSELFEIPVSELEWFTFYGMDIDKLLKKIEFPQNIILFII